MKKCIFAVRVFGYSAWQMALARMHTPWKFRNTPRSCMHIEKLTNELVIRILPSIPIPVITFDKN